jgi:sugar phosphate isomerase/epimerase
MAARPSGGPEIGLAHLSLLEVPPVDLIEMLAPIGYRSLGVRAHPAFAGSTFYDLPAGSQALRDVKAALRQTGMRVHDVEFVVVDEYFIPEAVLPLLETAAELGAKVLTICGEDHDGVRLVEHCQKLCALAGGFNIRIELEFMAWRRIGTLDQATDLLRRVDDDRMGILLDALHLSRAGSEPEALAMVDPAWLKSVQLCDAVAEKPRDPEGLIREARGGRLMVGQGVLPLARLLRQVPEDAAFSLEIPYHGPDMAQHAVFCFETAMEFFKKRQRPD